MKSHEVAEPIEASSLYSDASSLYSDTIIGARLNATEHESGCSRKEDEMYAP